MYRRLTGPIRRRLKLMLSRAVGRMVDPSTLLQTMQLELLKGEVLDNIEHLEGYGRTANPPEGFEALCASLGGDRAHTVALAAWHRKYRPTGFKRGENAIYDDQGQVIALLRDKHIQIYGCNTLTVDAAEDAIINTKRCAVNASESCTLTAPLVTVAASTKVRFETPLLECTGPIKDNCDSGGVSMADMRQVYNGHNHAENDNGGPTDPPNQIME
jgi:phage baseplate assembly protein V